MFFYTGPHGDLSWLTKLIRFNDNTMTQSMLNRLLTDETSAGKRKSARFFFYFLAFFFRINLDSLFTV